MEKKTSGISANLPKEVPGSLSVNASDESREWICGRGAVLEALKGERAADTLYLAKGAENLSHLAAIAKARGITVKDTDRKKLDLLSGGANHQGVMLRIAALPYAEVPDILAAAAEKGEQPFLLLCDGIEDPHNLGALLRTAEAAGVHGVIIPKRRQTGLTWAACKAAAGAAEHMPVARTANLTQCITDLKQKGIWVYGADMSGTDYRKQDFSGGAALVIGAEGQGLSRLVKENCDVLVSLPMRGKINSLNASVAGGILMYAIAVSREQ
jgi:23S rRNA (guanosine2251-2'-O)-methyltransferase